MVLYIQNVSIFKLPPTKSAYFMFTLIELNFPFRYPLAVKVGNCWNVLEVKGPKHRTLLRVPRKILKYQSILMLTN